MRLFLELMFFSITAGVLPVMVNKSTEVHLDWVRRWLRELWFGVIVFFLVYWMITKPEIAEVVVDLHKSLDGWPGYVIVGIVGLIFFCGFWWFTGHIANNPKVESTQEKDARQSSDRVALLNSINDFISKKDENELRETFDISTVTRDAILEAKIQLTPAATQAEKNMVARDMENCT